MRQLLDEGHVDAARAHLERLVEQDHARLARRSA